MSDQPQKSDTQNTMTCRNRELVTPQSAALNATVQAEALRLELQRVCENIRQETKENEDDHNVFARRLFKQLKTEEKASVHDRNGALHLRMWFVTASCTSGEWGLLCNWLAAADRRIAKLQLTEATAAAILKDYVLPEWYEKRNMKR